MSPERLTAPAYTSTHPYLRGRNDGESVHDPVGVFLADLGDEESAHARASATAEGVCQLEALETVAVLGLFPDDVEHGVDQFSAFCVVPLRPVVSCAALTWGGRQSLLSIFYSLFLSHLIVMCLFYLIYFVLSLFVYLSIFLREGSLFVIFLALCTGSGRIFS